ncbi:MAG: M14 family metallopeptidase, partial [Bacillota bacterium]
MTKKSVILLILSFNMILNISFSQVPYSYETIDLKIDILSKTSKLIESEKIGSSVKGKNIKVLKVGKGKTHYLITGGMHARENINPSILLWTADYLVKERKDLLKDVTIHIIPLLNPDGYKLAMNPKAHFIFGNDWKASELKSNFNGVDLNKNFPTTYWDHQKDKLMDTKDQIKY